MIIRSFKKQLLPDKFDLNFIFATNDDAVRYVIFPFKSAIINDNLVYQNNDDEEKSKSKIKENKKS